MQQPIWGNDYFRSAGTTLFFPGWVRAGVLYVKDLIKQTGDMMTAEELYDIIHVKTDIIRELYIVKNSVIKKVNRFDVSIAPYVKIKKLTHFMHKDKYIDMMNCKSKDYYNMLCIKKQSRGHMESIFGREFNICGDKIWTNVYSQKISGIKITKLAEFNYKLLNNIIPCGNILGKWQRDISQKCDFCNCIETTKHMLFDCPRISNVWLDISTLLGFNIKWKHIVCGYPGYDITKKISLYNYILVIISYAIFKVNSKCKFEKRDYGIINVKHIIKDNLLYYDCICKLEDRFMNSNMISEIAQHL